MKRYNTKGSKTRIEWPEGYQAVGVWGGGEEVRVWGLKDGQLLFDVGSFGRGSRSRGRPEQGSDAGRIVDPGNSESSSESNKPVPEVPLNQRAERQHSGFHRRRGTWAVGIQSAGFSADPELWHARAWFDPLETELALARRGHVHSGVAVLRKGVPDTFSALPGAASECLLLSLEEAGYLVYEKRWLRLLHSLAHRDHPFAEIPREAVLNEFALKSQDFAFRYAAYRHYRSQGWVPRSGLKYGASLVLYRAGPAQFHAEWAVRVLREEEYESMRMCTLQNMNRVCEQVGKGVRLCIIRSLDESKVLNADLFHSEDSSQTSANGRSGYTAHGVSLVELQFRRFIPDDGFSSKVKLVSKQQSNTKCD